MNAIELREKSIDELKALDSEYRRRLFDLRFKHYTGQLVNTADLKATRRGIARIQTVIRERSLLQGAAE
jgi:large subunit ribosomal protein L29